MEKKLKKRETTEAFARSAFPEQTFEEAKKEFREFYISELENLLAAEKAFRNLISLLLKGQNFPEPKITSRVKDRNECIRKFDRKYRDVLESAGVQYTIKDHISDLIGVRVVCIYESDIELVSDILRKHFTVIEETDKSRQIEDTENSFGYKGLHLDLKLNSARQKLPEYNGIDSQRFEVQIRTLVQDAWSEVDHKLKYKRQTPNEIQRRISRLAALFELADQEFEAVRDLSNELEELALDKSKEIDEVHSALDLVGFLRVAEEYFPGVHMYGEPLENLLGDIRGAKDSLTVAEFRGALDAGLDEIRKYMAYLSQLGHSMSPFTQIRHALYRYQPTVFEPLIFDGHRKNFDRWQNYKTVHPREVEMIKKGILSPEES